MTLVERALLDYLRSHPEITLSSFAKENGVSLGDVKAAWKRLVWDGMIIPVDRSGALDPRPTQPTERMVIGVRATPVIVTIVEGK